MISDIELKKLQKLARITFSAEEEKTFLFKLENILSMIDEIRTVDSEGVEPLRSVCEINQRMRDDAITAHDISDDLFKNVPGNISDSSANFAREIKCFIVPKVVE